MEAAGADGEDEWSAADVSARPAPSPPDSWDGILSVLAAAPLAAAVLDDRHRLVSANAAFAGVIAALGGGPRSDADLVRAALIDVVPDLAATLPTLLTPGRIIDRAVVRSNPPDGRERGYWRVSAFPVAGADGAPLGLGLFLEDVSQEQRTARRLADSVARLDVTLSAGGLVTWDWDILRNEATWGGEVDEVFGVAVDRDDHRPASFLEAIHPDDRDDHRRQIVAAARAATDFRNEVRVARTDGETQWIEVRGRVVTAADGTPRRMIGVAADITERRLMEEIKARLLEREHRARVEAETARERLVLLAEVGGALASRLDTRWILDTLPQLLVPRICDWCVVDLLTDAGDLELVSLVHADPGGADDVYAIRRLRQQGGGDGLWSVRRSIRERSSELVLDINQQDLAGAATSPEHLAILERLAPRSAITLPLISQGQVFGGLTVVATHDRRFEPDDMILMENVAGRVAMALENAQLFESGNQVTRALQQTLLPPVLPAIPAVDLVARYRVAADGIDIGGDFYDAYEMSDGEWALVVGDVCGRGAGAAAVTGLFRHTVRAVAMSERSPARILRATNDTILGQIDDTRYCTAVFVALRPGEHLAEASVACGGHPRPMIVRADGTVERLDVSGTLLGVLPEPALAEVEITLAPGDAIVLYTDGVTEARRGSDQFGEARLIDALRSAATDGVVTAGGLADRVELAVDQFQAGAAGDDIAIVVARINA